LRITSQVMPSREHIMSNEQKSQEQAQGAGGQAQPQGQQQGQQQEQAQGQQQAGQDGSKQQDFDGLENKKPEELTPEELRLMADTMPGEGPGD
jgi:hypothetical protein